ncbi:MAG: 30S ribosomal protein S16 [Patescibacteria group bacterium]
MSVKIRLLRIGKKKFPQYRIVVMDSKKARNSLYIEQVGSYNPLLSEKQLIVDQPAIDVWIKKGAQFSDGLNRLLRK